MKLVESADAVKYKWFDAEVVSTPSVMNIKVVIKVVRIVVGDPLE